MYVIFLARRTNADAGNRRGELALKLNLAKSGPFQSQVTYFATSSSGSIGVGTLASICLAFLLFPIIPGRIAAFVASQDPGSNVLSSSTFGS